MVEEQVYQKLFAVLEIVDWTDAMWHGYHMVCKEREFVRIKNSNRSNVEV